MSMRGLMTWNINHELVSESFTTWWHYMLLRLLCHVGQFHYLMGEVCEGAFLLCIYLAWNWTLTIIQNYYFSSSDWSAEIGAICILFKGSTLMHLGGVLIFRCIQRTDKWFNVFTIILNCSNFKNSLCRLNMMDWRKDISDKTRL